MKYYGFIVDTNKYAGNFERQLCAYMTGRTGDCGVGHKEAREYEEDELKPLESVMDKPDENGVYRPVSIYPTPNMWNNGMGFEYKEGQEELALSKYKQSIKDYYEQQINRVENNRGKGLATWTDEAVDREIKSYEKTIADANAKTEPGKYPAYLSVIIYFEKKPTSDEIIFLKQRAEQYVSEYAILKNIQINGYRLVEIETIVNETITNV